MYSELHNCTVNFFDCAGLVIDIKFNVSMCNVVWDTNINLAALSVAMSM